MAVFKNARHDVNLIKPVQVLVRIMPLQVNAVHGYTLYIRHQLTQPLLPRMDINLRGGDTFIAEQGLEVDQLHILF